MPRRTLATGRHAQRRGAALGRHQQRQRAARRPRRRASPSASGAASRRRCRHARTMSGATERRTGLGEGDNAIYTVEHLLAAAFALGLDDMAVEVEGPELPILDGSFEPWLAALADGGRRGRAGHRR